MTSLIWCLLKFGHLILLTQSVKPWCLPFQSTKRRHFEWKFTSDSVFFFSHLLSILPAINKSIVSRHLNLLLNCWVAYDRNVWRASKSWLPGLNHAKESTTTINRVRVSKKQNQNQKKKEIKLEWVYTHKKMLGDEITSRVLSCSVCDCEGGGESCYL